MVSRTTNQAVTWSLGGDECPGLSCGTISADGLYTAPAVVPVPPAVTVTATSQADTSAFDTATATVVSDVAVSVWPASAKIRINDTYQFSHTLTGSSDASVTWSLSASGCTDAECGTIDSSGLYTAPTAMISPLRYVLALERASSDPTCDEIVHLYHAKR